MWKCLLQREIARDKVGSESAEESAGVAVVDTEVQRTAFCLARMCAERWDVTVVRDRRPSCPNEVTTFGVLQIKKRGKAKR